MAVIRVGTKEFGQRARERKARLEMGYPLAGGGMMKAPKDRSAISKSDAEQVRIRLKDYEPIPEAKVERGVKPPPPPPKKPVSKTRRKLSAPYGERR